MTDSDIVIMHGIYIALCSALSEQGVELANDILRHLADDPKRPPAESRIFRMIAESSSAGFADGRRPMIPRPVPRGVQ